MEYENCAGDTDCCRIIAKYDKELGLVAGKARHKNLYFITQKNYATRNSKNLKERIRVLE